MKIKLSSVISLLMATIIVLGALFTSCAPEKKESQVAKYLNKILEATFAGIDDSEPQVTTSKLNFKNTPDLGIPHFVGAEMTLITGLNGESVISTDLTLDSGKADLSIYNAGLTVIAGSSILGSEKYGFELTDAMSLVELFTAYFMPVQPAPGLTPNTAANDTASEQAGSSISGLLGSLEGINSLLDGNNPEKVYGLLEKYAKIIANAAEGACKSNVKTGNEVVVSVEFNTDSAKKLIKDVFASLKKDKELKSIVESVLVTSGIPKDEAKAQLDAIFSDEMARTIYDALDAAPFTLKAEVNADKDYILTGVSIEYKSQGSGIKLFYNGEEEGKAELGFVNTVSGEGVFHRQENKIVFESKTVNGTDMFEISSVQIVDNNAHAETLFKTEIKDGKYTATMQIPDDVEGPWSLTIAGETKTEGKTSTLSITSATAFGRTLAVDLTVVTEIGGTVPEFPTNFKNILDVTGDEFKAITDKLENSPLGQFMSKEETEIVLPDVE